MLALFIILTAFVQQVWSLASPSVLIFQNKGEIHRLFLQFFLILLKPLNLTGATLSIYTL